MSQRRQNRDEGVDLSGQDNNMDRESWMPASQHQQEYEDDDEVEHVGRGREEERVAA